MHTLYTHNILRMTLVMQTATFAVQMHAKYTLTLGVCIFSVDIQEFNCQPFSTHLYKSSHKIQHIVQQFTICIQPQSISCLYFQTIS